MSSPVQAATRRRIVQKAEVSDQLDLPFNSYSHNKLLLSDDEISIHNSDDESDDPRPQTRGLRAPYGQRKKRLGPPITTDEKIEGLNTTHRLVVDDFMVHATKECRQVSPRQVYQMHTSRRWNC